VLTTLLRARLGGLCERTGDVGSVTRRPWRDGQERFADLDDVLAHSDALDHVGVTRGDALVGTPPTDRDGLCHDVQGLAVLLWERSGGLGDAAVLADALCELLLSSGGLVLLCHIIHGREPAVASSGIQIQIAIVSPRREDLPGVTRAVSENKDTLLIRGAGGHARVSATRPNRRPVRASSIAALSSTQSRHSSTVGLSPRWAGAGADVPPRTPVRYGPRCRTISSGRTYCTSRYASLHAHAGYSGRNPSRPVDRYPRVVTAPPLESSTLDSRIQEGSYERKREFQAR